MQVRIKDLEEELLESNSPRSISMSTSNNSKRSKSFPGKSNISLAQWRIGLKEDIATLKAMPIALSQER